MARFYGAIGFSTETETSPGVWEENIMERPYYGDYNNHGRRLQIINEINPEITTTATISVLSDAYAFEHRLDMRYAVVDGQKWQITNADIERPRIVISLGGKWNGR